MKKKYLYIFICDRSFVFSLKVGKVGKVKYKNNIYLSKGSYKVLLIIYITI